MEENDEWFILLTADEFFNGNTIEERTDDLPIKSRNELLSRNISSDNLLYTDNLDIKEIANIIKSSDR